MEWIQLLLDESEALSELATRREESMARAAGQTRSRCQVLATLLPRDHTVPQVARRLGVTRQSVQRLSDRLAEDGLVRFVPNPDHKRSPRLTLTEQGRDLANRLKRAENDWKETIVDHIETEDLETTLYTLRALRDVL
jgi:DNA-binding MarR family transcriptional regulator